jgi:hypothetical protein
MPREGGRVDEIIRAVGMVLVFVFAVLSASFESAFLGYLAIAIGIITMLYVVLVSESRWR